ncbi:MAG: hypothetical protein JWQ64_2111 [Subtercola sp.]|nr:hypothetical protein [Subtercola sp.]
MKIRRPMIGAILAATIASFALVNGQTASAAPANCSGPDAPPACHHTPPPPPTPAVLETVALSPIANIPNDFWVQMDNVTLASVAAFADGSNTTFRMSISCSNGFFRSGPMRVDRTSGGTQAFLSWKTRAVAGAASGSCFASTWDQATLGVAHTIYSVDINPPSDPTGAGWDIEFGPNSWGPAPHSN